MKQHLSYILAVIMILSCFAFPAYAEESSADAVSTEESSAPDASVSSEEPISSEEPEITYQVKFEATDTATFMPVSGVMFELGTGDVCYSGGSFDAVGGADLTFTVTPTAGKAIVKVMLGGTTELKADAAGVYTVSALSGDITILVQLGDKAPSTVTVNVSNANATSDKVGGSTTFDDSKQYYVGDKLELAINPESNFGIVSVTVNGSARDDVNPFGMDISIDVTDNVTVDVVFAKFWIVGTYITTLDEDGNEDNEVGGSIVADGIHEDQLNGSLVNVLEGTSIKFKIKREQGYRLAKLTLDGIDVTKSVDRSSYFTIESISKHYELEATFEPYEEETHSITTIVNGTGGTVSPDGTVQIADGEMVKIEFFPLEGFKIGTVTIDGRPVNVTGTSLQIEADGDHTVAVSFVKLDGSEVSEPPVEDSSTEESRPDTGFTVTVNDVNIADVGSEVRIDISKKSLVSTAALVRLNELLAAGKNVYIGEPDVYWWYIPAGSKLTVPTGDAGGLDGLNFNVSINDGAKSQAMRDAIKAQADKYNYKNTDNITVERDGAFKLPEEARLRINVTGTFTALQTIDWMKYDDLKNSFVNFYSEHNGYLSTVGADGWAELTMPGNSRYGMLILNIDGSSTIKIEWDGTQCSPSVPCTSEVKDGVSYGTFAWQDGKKLIVNIIVRDGFCIESITSPDFASQIEITSSGVVLGDNGKGGKGTVTINITGISKDGSIIVKTVGEVGNDTATPGNTVDWQLIILIAVIAIAMIGGGVVFVIKWRQNDDEDDEDSEEEDDEDDFEEFED